MKQILIICGTGVATSTLVSQKVLAWLEKTNLRDTVSIEQSSVMDAVSKLNHYDVVITTTVITEDVNTHIIDGTPLLTGVNEENVFQTINHFLRN